MQDNSTPKRRIRPRGLSAIEAIYWHGLVSDGDCLVWTRGKDRLGYGKLSHNYATLATHRVVFEAAYGPIPEGMEVDHICRNRSCCEVTHLRLVTRKQNLENHNGPYANNTSGVRGVCWVASNRKWRATVGHFGRIVYVGQFDDLEAAEKAVVAKRLELHTHNNADRSAR